MEELITTGEYIASALREMSIRPVNGMVTTKQAALILSWRAEHEDGIVHEYTQSAVRRRVSTGTLSRHHQSTRRNRYRVEELFEIELQPQRRGQRAA